MAHAASAPGRYGLLAEFDSADALLAAAKKVSGAGYTKIDAFSPMPIHGLAEAIGFHEHLVPKIILGGGITGLLTGYGLQYWTQVLVYPINVGGRPFHSWPAFIVPTFECAILGAALAAVFGMFFLNGLPQPYHPVFNVPRFALASRDRYFLVVESRDPKFDPPATRRLLTDLRASEVSDVAH